MIIEQFVEAKDLCAFLQCVDGNTVESVELDDYGDDYVTLKVSLNSNKVKK